MKRYKNGDVVVRKRNKNNRWYPLQMFTNEETALELLEAELIKCGTTVIAEMGQILDQKLYDWSRNVKIAHGWVCKCGELDRELLESHHVKPRHLFPDLIYNLDNGECVCLFCHAKRHAANPAIQNKILARLAIILYSRYNPCCSTEEISI